MRLLVILICLAWAGVAPAFSPAINAVLGMRAAAGGGAPTLADYQTSTLDDRTTGDEVTAAITWQSGDVILVLGATEDSPVLFDTPTASGLAFSLVVSDTSANNSTVYAWAATAAGNGSSQVTAVPLGDTGSQMRGLISMVWRGSAGIGNYGTRIGSTTPTAALSRGTANSAVATIHADWNALSDTAVTATPSGGTVRSTAHVSLSATFFAATWPDQGTTGSADYGITDYTGTPDISSIAVEIRGQ